MKHVVSKIIGVVAIVSLVFIINTTKDIETIKIGAIYPLSGFASAYGETEKIATEYVVREINQNGGIGGKKLEVIYEDGKCSGKDALSAAKKLIEIDKIQPIILGGGCSSETLSFAAYAQDRNVLVFTSMSASSELSKYKNIRNMVVAKDDAELIGKMVASRHKRIAIISENNDFPLDIYSHVIGSYIPSDRIVFSEVFQLNLTDFRSQILKIKESQPDAIMIFTVTGKTAGLFIKQLRELDVDIPTYSSEAPGANDFLTTAGSYAEGIVYSDIPYIDYLMESEKLQDLFDYFLENKSQPISDYLAIARYDSLYLIKNAIERCSGVIVNCMADILRNEKFDGLLGSYIFDQNGDAINIKPVLKTYKNNRVVEYKNI